VHFASTIETAGKRKKILKAMEMFENKSIRDISKVSAKIFFGVDKSSLQVSSLINNFSSIISSNNRLE